MPPWMNLARLHTKCRRAWNSVRAHTWMASHTSERVTLSEKDYHSISHLICRYRRLLLVLPLRRGSSELVGTMAAESHEKLADNTHPFQMLHHNSSGILFAPNLAKSEAKSQQIGTKAHMTSHESRTSFPFTTSTNSQSSQANHTSSAFHRFRVRQSLPNKTPHSYQKCIYMWRPHMTTALCWMVDSVCIL